MTNDTVDTTIIDPRSSEAQLPPEQEGLAKAWSTRLESEFPWTRAEMLARVGFRVLALNTLQAEVGTTSDPRVRARCYFVAGKIREQFGEFEAADRCY